MVRVDDEVLMGLIGDEIPEGDTRVRVARSLTSKLAAIQRIGRAIEAAHEKLRREEARHAEARAAIEAEIREVQRRCGHEKTSYHGDPAGGYGSFTSCEICGAAW